jgi:BASS family bile acid:Na+ symporter
MDELQRFAAAFLSPCVIVFMAANLAAIGLELDFKAALAPLHNRRFVALVMVWDWLFCPGLAWLLARIVPMEQPYAIGLILIGMTPAAPFLPMMVRMAGGDLAYAAAFMLVAAIGTVVFMPIALPILAPGFSVDAWTIARPLVMLLFAPLAAGLAISTRFPALAARLRRPVRLLGDGAAVVLLTVIIVLYYDGFIGAVGSYAVGTQFLYAVATTFGAYVLGARLKPEQRSVISLGVCSRNLGAAIAPLLAVNGDPHTTVMVALGVPITLFVTFLSARLFANQAPQSRRA